MSEHIKWQEPPAPKAAPWGEIAEALRSNPGRWALVAESTSSSRASSIRNGILVPFRPSGAFEARTVRVGDEKHDIYARYVGEAGEQA